MISEVRRLEEVSQRNEDELGSLSSSTDGGQQHQQQLQQLHQQQQLSPDDAVIKSEISQLRQRLAGTDQELHKTNMTLRYLHTFSINKLRYL